MGVVLLWLGLGAILPFLPAVSFFCALGLIPSPIWILPLPIGAWLAWRLRRRAWLISLLFMFACVNLELSLTSRSGGDSSVLFVNIHKESREVPHLLRLIRESRVQTVVIQENRGGPASPASHLHGSLPGWNLVSDGAEGAILSVHPLEDVRVVKQNTAPELRVLSVWVRGPQPYRLVTMHGIRPHVREPDAIARQLRMMAADVEQARAVATGEEPTIVAGDFNLPSRSPLFGRLSAGFLDGWHAGGRGLGYNYPAGFPLMRISHFLLRGRFSEVGSEVGPGVGSDHRPILVRFRLE